MKINTLMPNFEKRGGLVPVIVQNIETLEVLMLAYTNRDCFLETLESGLAVFYSTSRNARWMKGETSGDYIYVYKILIDCDRDALVYLVCPKSGIVCHLKKRSCFHNNVISYKYSENVRKLQTEEREVHYRISDRARLEKEQKNKKAKKNRGKKS